MMDVSFMKAPVEKVPHHRVSSSRNEFSSLPSYEIPQSNRKLLLESRKMNFHFISAFIFGLPSTFFYVHIFRKYEFFMGLCLRRRAMYLWRAVRFVVFTTKFLLNWVLWLFARNYHNLDFAAQYLRIKWSVQGEENFNSNQIFTCFVIVLGIKITIVVIFCTFAFNLHLKGSRAFCFFWYSKCRNLVYDESLFLFLSFAFHIKGCSQKRKVMSALRILNRFPVSA